MIFWLSIMTTTVCRLYKRCILLNKLYKKIIHFNTNLLRENNKKIKYINKELGHLNNEKVTSDHGLFLFKRMLSEIFFKDRDIYP